MFKLFKKSQEEEDDVIVSLDDIGDRDSAVDEDDFEVVEIREDDFKEEKLPKRKKKQNGFIMEDAVDSDDDDEEKGHPILRAIRNVIVGIIGFAVVAYLLISAFFINHFYYGTRINDVDFSMKTAHDVESYMSKQVDDYVLTLNELNKVTEKIVGKDIAIKYKQSTQIKRAMKNQNPILWVRAIWDPDVLNVDVGVEYDEAKLAETISKLKCMDESKWTKSTSAKPEYNGTEFVPGKEIYGTAIDTDAFNKAVREKITQFIPELNMEEVGCYQKPKYISSSPEVKAAADQMNNMSKAKVVYHFGDKVAVVNRDKIKDWLTLDTNTMKVGFNEGKVDEYLALVGKVYDTVGKDRTFKSPTGKQVTIGGGTYGWEIDEAAEAAALKEHIKKGEVLDKEPAYVQRAASYGDVDWGSTYAEVDLELQHMWYIKDGKIAFECDVVTGLPTPKRETPTGVHQCLEKAQNKVLRGDRTPGGGYEYETPVAYWMRVTWSGVGFHTATWQPAFGGNRYTYAGSHGCINMSYNDSVTLYGIIQVHDAVIIHK